MGEEEKMLQYIFFPLSEPGVGRKSVEAIEKNQGGRLQKGISRQQKK